jgi:4-diphosphocytidyl-2C-methyl-D-erythritol kinase
MALIVPAYAKLNLTLDVLGRRPNGYHDIDSLMQTISLHGRGPRPTSLHSSGAAQFSCSISVRQGLSMESQNHISSRGVGTPRDLQ